MYFNDDDHTRLEQTVRSVTTIATIPSLIVILFLVIFGEQLLVLTYGSFYGSGQILLVILVAGTLSDVAFGPAGFTLIMSGNQATHLRIMVITGVCAIILSILGGLLWGTLGVACMVAFSTIAQNFLTLCYAKKKAGIICCTYIKPLELITLFKGIRNLSTNLKKKRNPSSN